MSAPGGRKRESFTRRREGGAVDPPAARPRSLDLPLQPYLGVALLVLLVFALAPRGALPDVPATAPFLPPWAPTTWAATWPPCACRGRARRCWSVSASPCWR
ncbi:MAG: hypothetical protein MUF32_02730 [Burkholderiaceae bacterium]|nr:hypothetical protein [Burkholderiaceae bacterium]